MKPKKWKMRNMRTISTRKKTPELSGVVLGDMDINSRKIVSCIGTGGVCIQPLYPCKGRGQRCEYMFPKKSSNLLSCVRASANNIATKTSPN